MNPKQVMSSGPYSNVEENYQQYKTYSISFYFKMFEMPSLDTLMDIKLQVMKVVVLKIKRFSIRK